jgi:pSer/pThr/pTyr-binding forkhead associated (FHA) protein/flagellar motor switch/type III secretory pathway protein FliN
MGDQVYRFSTLEKFPRESIGVINRAYDFLASSETTSKLLKSVSETLLSYDIFNVSDMEIGLLVKPAGSVSKPQFHRLQQPVIHIGRSNESDVSLKSPLVSKKHAEIFAKGTEYYLKDLGSNNGTHLNQVRLTPGSEVLLKNEDIIRIEPFEIAVGLSVDVAKRPLEISFTGARVNSSPQSGGQLQIYFEIQPSKHTGVVLIDQSVAKWMVQKIITGQKENLHTAWTEIESGLLEYLSCKILSVLNPSLKNSRLMFHSVETDPARFLQFVSGQQKFIELGFGATTEIGMIYSFVYLPSDCISQPDAQRTDLEEFLLRAAWLGELKYPFSIQIGVSLLVPEQIDALSDGDILLLDRTGITLDKNVPAGVVDLRSERLRRGAIHGSLVCNDKGSCSITVQSFYQEGLTSMTEANKKTDAPQEKAAAPDVVANLEIPINVEFARLSFTLEELSSLKEGQIIELEKSQPELVDLSVEGKIIANGKLVDVEGKLGVRLLRVLKPK